MIKIIKEAMSLSSEGKALKKIIKSIIYYMDADQLKDYVNSIVEEVIEEDALEEGVLREDTSDQPYDLAKEVSDNIAGESDAISGYESLLGHITSVYPDDSEGIDLIEEIISDEKNHIEKLNQYLTDLDQVDPAKD